MEKNYLYNLYKNIEKYNLKLNNNSYIIHKINSLYGGVDDAEAQQNIDDLNALLSMPATTPVPHLTVDPRDTLIEELIREAEDFLTKFEEYKRRIETGMTNISEDDISKLNNIQQTFENIKIKIGQLV